MTSKPKKAVRLGSSAETGDMEPDIIRGATNNDLQEVQAALESDPFCINKQDSYSLASALHIAAQLGNISMVTFLIGQPHIVFSKDKWLRDPLDVAIFSGHPLVIKELFRFRAESLGLAGRKHGTPNSGPA